MRPSDVKNCALRADATCVQHLVQVQRIRFQIDLKSVEKWKKNQSNDNDRDEDSDDLRISSIAAPCACLDCNAVDTRTWTSIWTMPSRIDTHDRIERSARTSRWNCTINPTDRLRYSWWLRSPIFCNREKWYRISNSNSNLGIWRAQRSPTDDDVHLLFVLLKCSNLIIIIHSEISLLPVHSKLILCVFGALRYKQQKNIYIHIHTCIYISIYI